MNHSLIDRQLLFISRPLCDDNFTQSPRAMGDRRCQQRSQDYHAFIINALQTGEINMRKPHHNGAPGLWTRR